MDNKRTFLFNLGLIKLMKLIMQQVITENTLNRIKYTCLA